MSSLNIHHLYQPIHEKNQRRLKMFDDILKKVHSRIVYNSKLEKTHCFFQIPEFIIGYPIYNVRDLKQYIMNSLQKDGFHLLYVDPNWLFISWDAEVIKKQPRQQKKKQKQSSTEFRTTKEYKPSGGFVYNAFDLSSIQDTSHQLLQ
jgi:hypothetical protein